MMYIIAIFRFIIYCIHPSMFLHGII